MNTIFSKFRGIRDIFDSLNGSDEYEYYEDDTEGSNYQELYQQENPTTAIEHQGSQRPSRTRERPAPVPAVPEVANIAAKQPIATRSNVIGMPGAANGISEVVVIEPRSFEEMPQVIQALRERKSVVLNLTIIDPDEAQRAVDFVAGGTYAIDGHQERIGESIFLFTPSCVQVSTQAPNVTVQEMQPAAVNSASAVRAVAAAQAQAANWSLDPNRLAQ